MKKRLLWVPALLLSLPLAFAQAPSGPVSFFLDRNTFPVWDFTGEYTLNQQIVGIGSISGLSIPVFITHDQAGRLRASGTTLVTIGSDVVAANFVLAGTVSGGGNNTRVIFHIRLTGRDNIAGQERGFSIALNYNLRVDPDPGNAPALIAPVRGNPVSGVISISGLGSARVIPGDNFAVALPPGVDGAWSINMNILSLNRLGGTAAIVIDTFAPGGGSIIQPTTRTLTANLVGIYRPTLTVSQIVLTGTGDSRGAALRVNFFNGATQPSLVGKMLGQTIRF